MPAQKINSCDCDILQVNETDNLMGYQNFTNQNRTLNGKPFYFSTQGNILYWKSDSWSYSGPVYDNNLKHLVEINSYHTEIFNLESVCKGKIRTGKANDVIKTQCLKHNNACFARRGAIFNVSDETLNMEIELVLRTNDPCKFPFIYENVTYTSCTKKDFPSAFWCATTVNATNHYQGHYGYCNDLCPNEDQCDCNVLQVNESDDLMGNQNFTKQNGTWNGKPFYFSMQQGRISWNIYYWSYDIYHENLKRFVPGHHYNEEIFSLKTVCKGGRIGKIQRVQREKTFLIKTQCLRDNNNCSAEKELAVTFLDEVHNRTTEHKLKATQPCTFPFVYKNVKYYSCTNIDFKTFWCATTVNASNHYQQGNWGYCNHLCTTEDSLNSTPWLLMIVVGSFIFLFILSIILYLYYAKRKKEIDTVMNGNLAMINPSLILNEQAAHLSYSGKCEIERSKFEIGRKLGGGSFGSVYEGTTKDGIHLGQKNKVAIKSVNNTLDPTQIYALMCEIKLLDKLEMHLNLVNMIGACTKHFSSGRIWLLLEHCPHGDMKNFLLKYRDVILQGLDDQVPHEHLNIRLFIKWSHSISKGMEYLASKNIMHGDLAARNILITNFTKEENYLAKICDFGLSKAFYDKTSYEKQDRNNIPWKWMDVIFFETRKFRLSSDVWSFGVVFWEMLSMGRFPYAGEDMKETIDKIKIGFRLPVPDEVSKVNWLSKCYSDVTKMCWQLDPKERFSFTDLIQTFETYLTDEEKERYNRLEQHVIQSKAKLSEKRKSKQELSKEAISYNKMQENVSNDDRAN